MVPASPCYNRCRGKRVAVVGRAPTLTAEGSGEAIDTADFVIRVNWDLPVPRELETAAGKRTDLLITHRTLNWAVLHGNAHRLGVKAERVSESVRNHLAMVVAGPQEGRYYMPNTGTVVIWEALNAGAASVTPYGFDFHTSTRYVGSAVTHNRREKWARHRLERKLRTHNPDLDRAFVRGLMETEPRLEVVGALRGVLEESQQSISVAPTDLLTALEDLIKRWRADATRLAQYGQDPGARMCLTHADELATAIRTLPTGIRRMA